MLSLLQQLQPAMRTFLVAARMDSLIIIGDGMTAVAAVPHIVVADLEFLLLLLTGAEIDILFLFTQTTHFLAASAAGPWGFAFMFASYK